MLKNSNSLPLVLIRVPAYNHRQYLEKCLESIASDDYPNKIVVVRDDCSIDGTAEIAKKKCKYLGFNFRSNEINQGICATLNLITAEYPEADLHFNIASDDQLVRGGIRAGVEELCKNASLGGVYARVNMIDTRGNSLGEMKNSRVSGMIFRDVILGRVGIPHQWMLWRSEVFNRVGGYDIDSPLEDQSFFNKAAKFYNIGFVDAVWVEYRRHPANSTKKVWRIYEASRKLTHTYRDEDFYPEMLAMASLNWWLLLAQEYPSEARRYFLSALAFWKDRRFWAGLLYFIKLGSLVNKFRR